jgi:phosphatidylserine/phosphatidylglycerophosphate/cardiolipin synthase-like enzyme
VETSGVAAPAAVGWAMVTTSPNVDLTGTAIFQCLVAGSVVAEASAPAMMPVAAVDFYADEDGGSSTGFAIVNPGSSTAQGTLALRRADGTPAGTIPITVEPGHHLATYLWQVMPGAPSGRAELSFDSGYVAAIALRFHSASVFSTLPVGTPGFASSGADAHFSPNGGVRARVVAAIGRAQATIDIAIYSFTADAISDALIQARNRGVAVRIIADESQADGLGSEIAKLEGLGFNLRRASGTSGGIMHNKYMIIDGRVLLTGSYNWSAGAENNNFEDAVFLQGSRVVRRFREDFEKIWSR